MTPYIFRRQMHRLPLLGPGAILAHDMSRGPSSISLVLPFRPSNSQSFGRHGPHTPSMRARGVLLKSSRCSSSGERRWQLS
jgi:hypothetical protein